MRRDSFGGYTYLPLHPENVVMIPAYRLHPDNISNFLREYCSNDVCCDLFMNLYQTQIRKGDEIVSGKDDFGLYKFKVSELVKSSHPCLVRLPTERSYPRPIKDLAIDFSSLKKDADILSFAKKHGLLGVLSALGLEKPDYFFTVFEPVSLWKRHIAHIKRLVRLSQALTDIKNGKDVDIYEEFVTLKEGRFYRVGKGYLNLFKISWSEKYSLVSDKYDVFGMEPKKNKIPEKLSFPLPLTISEIDDKQEFDKALGAYVLVRLIKEGLGEAFKLAAFDMVESESHPIGFEIKEVYQTKYLLGAIYRDLWQIISANTLLRLCEYCGRPFPRKGKKRYCNDSCRVMASRKRQKTKEE